MNKEEEKYEWRVYQLQQKGNTRDLSEKIVQAQDKLREDVWQYLIDHKHIQPNGYFSFLIYAKNKEDFFRRLESRENGDFKRYDVFKTERGSKTIMKHYDELNSRRARHKGALTGKNILKKILAILYQKYISKI